MTREERYAALAETLVGVPGVVPPSDDASAPQRFGSTSLKMNGKIFAMLVRGRLVVKLPGQRVDVLIVSGEGDRFDPGHGRLMKEWLSIKPTAEDEWLPLAREAMEFVGDPRKGGEAVAPRFAALPGPRRLHDRRFQRLAARIRRSGVRNPWAGVQRAEAKRATRLRSHHSHAPQPGDRGGQPYAFLAILGKGLNHQGSYTIPPGHDAWVEGGEPFVGIEVMSAEQYAKPQS